MESIKRKWGKPGLDVQVFMPNDFIAACAPDETYRIYKFFCDASLGRYKYYGVYVDNGDGTFDSSSDSFKSYFEPCGATHTARVNTGAGETAESVFPVGWIRPATITYDYDYNRFKYEVISDSKATKVWLWYGENKDNTHATLDLKYDEYTEHNPS